ncbi:hypothetical protein FALCPG4_012627 [Fusarium falciforme]
MAKRLAAHKSLNARDTDVVLETDHHSNLTGITVNTASDVSSPIPPARILSLEGEIGPFWVKAQLVREDIVDEEPGVFSYMHTQFIDANTCEPVHNLSWDVWNCNSTGDGSNRNSADH